MRAVSVTAFAGLVLCAAGLAPARALPASAPVTAGQAVSPGFLLAVKHRWGHWHWRHRRDRWSRYVPQDGLLPETSTTETPVPRIAPGMRLDQPPAAASPTVNRGGNAPVSQPSIEWVDPDRAAR